IDACHRLLKKPSLDLPRALSNVAKAQAQAERAGRVLSGLRGFFYRGETRLETVTVDTLLESVRKLSEPESMRVGITPIYSGVAGATQILADRIHFEQVLMNLLRNAFEALSESTTLDPRVEVATRIVEDGVEIEVSDN